jgi:hypothetical protein
MSKTTHQLTNEIIAIFIENDTPLFKQLQILNMVRQKIEFCRKTGSEMKQLKIEL